MATAKSRPKAMKASVRKPSSTRRSTSKHKPVNGAKRPTVKRPAAVPHSKQDAVLALLRQPKGTSIAAVIKVTNWQPHSVRGFFAGTVKKKLKLNLISEKVGDERIYRIVKAPGER